MLARGLAKAGSWQTHPRRGTGDRHAGAVVVHDDDPTTRGTATHVDDLDELDDLDDRPPRRPPRPPRRPRRTALEPR
jgi:hypothetical protein